jgi:hypothetical protein
MSQQGLDPVVLLTSDGKKLEVSRSLALQAQHLKEMIEDSGSDILHGIPLREKSCTYPIMAILMRIIAETLEGIHAPIEETDDTVLKLIRATVFLQIPALLYRLAKVPGVLHLLLESKECCGDTVRELVDYGADVRDENERGESVLELAKRGHDEILIEVERGLLISQGWTQLMLEADKGKIERMHDLITPEAKDCKNFDENTALHYAARNGHTDAVALLIESRWDVNCKGKVQYLLDGSV